MSLSTAEAVTQVLEGITGYDPKYRSLVERILEISDETLLKIVVLAAGAILGGVIAYNIFQYLDIPYPWKIAISTFIVLLPISFFLQASLTVRAVRDERVSKVQDRLRKCSFAHSKEIADKLTRFDIRDDPTFTKIFQDVSGYLDEVDLYRYYQQAYEIRFDKDQERRRHYDIESMMKEVSEKEIERDLLDPSEANEKKRLSLIKEIDSLRNKIASSEKHLDEYLIINRLRFIYFDLGDSLEKVIDTSIRGQGIDFRSYFLPLSFFMFIYFAGFLVTIPLINSVFTGEVYTTYIPLFDSKQYVIPLLVVQWGFMGGLVYTSVNLLSRFLRKDINPSVYFNASFRLLLSTVVAVVIYFLYMFVYPDAVTKSELSPIVNISKIHPHILLICFLAGVAPVTFLIHFADSQLSRIAGWRRRDTAGNRSVTQLDGINSITSERLSEAGIDCIQQMALSNPNTIAENTKFPVPDTNDWKNQAVLYILTGDVFLDDKKKESLNDVLRKKFEIRTYWDLKNTWDDILKNPDGGAARRLTSFFDAIDPHKNGEKRNEEWFKSLFNSVIKNGLQFYNDNTRTEDVTEATAAREKGGSGGTGGGGRTVYTSDGIPVQRG